MYLFAISIIAILINLFFNFSIESFLMILEWVPIVVIFHIFADRVLNMDETLNKVVTALFFAIPINQTLQENYMIIMNMSSQFIFIAYVFFYSMKKRREKILTKDYWMTFFLFASFIPINHLWNGAAFLYVGSFISSELQVYKEVVGPDFSLNLIKTLYFFHPLKGYSEFINQEMLSFHDKFVFYKLGMVIIWAISWGGLYLIATRSHDGKMKFSNTYKLFSSKKYIDISIFILTFSFLFYQTYILTNFEKVFSGLLFLNLINTAIVFTLIVLFYSLFAELNKKKVYLINIFSLSILITSINTFEYLHTFLLNFPDFYLFSKYTQASIGTSLSLVFVTLCLIPVYVLSLILLNLLKKKFSVNFYILNLVFLSFFSIIYVTHETLVIKTINFNDTLNIKIIEKIIAETDKQKKEEYLKVFNKYQSTPIQKGNFDELEKDLLACEFCKINANSKIDFENLEKQLDKLKITNRTPIVKNITYNLKLLYIGIDRQGDIYYALRVSSTNSFMSLTYFGVFYLSIFIFWIFLLYFIQYKHTLMFKHRAKKKLEAKQKSSIEITNTLMITETGLNSEEISKVIKDVKG